ncbi:MAG TPA: hypothetical protein VHL34_23345, partial [Rhizomicrobium sp.]|nr:hypothetical protein [Rhizomicrobium sp.]
MAFDGYKLLKIARDGKIIFVTIDAPPINIFTLELYGEMARLAEELNADADATVVVVKSANTDFFIAHFDVAAILSFPIDQPAVRSDKDDNAF